MDKVLAKRKQRGKVQYLGSWVGYPPEENTWEPLKNLRCTKEVITEFVQENKVYEGAYVTATPHDHQQMHYVPRDLESRPLCG